VEMTTALFRFLRRSLTFSVFFRSVVFPFPPSLTLLFFLCRPSSPSLSLLILTILNNLRSSTSFTLFLSLTRFLSWLSNLAYSSFCARASRITPFLSLHTYHKLPQNETKLTRIVSPSLSLSHSTPPPQSKCFFHSSLSSAPLRGLRLVQGEDGLAFSGNKCQKHLLFLLNQYLPPPQAHPSPPYEEQEPFSFCATLFKYIIHGVKVISTTSSATVTATKVGTTWRVIIETFRWPVLLQNFSDL